MLHELLVNLIPRFKSYDTHVRISRQGQSIIDNDELMEKVVHTIMEKNNELSKGEIVSVDEEKISLEMVTSIKEAK